MSRPLRVLVDATHFWPNGQSGGIIPALQEIVRWLGQLAGPELRMVFVTNPAATASVAAWLRPEDRQIPADSAPADLASREDCDVVYCPFGITDWACPGIPTVTLMVDLLHLDFPDTLQPVDIQHRTKCLQLAVIRTDLFQVISNYTGQRLQLHGGVKPARIVRTYLPIQDRLLPHSERVRPADTAPYFFYPANAWAHKNHLTLLVAFAIYRQRTPGQAWRLVLTGHADHRMREVETAAASLGISAHVDFLGYVDESRLAETWAAAGALVFPSLHEGFGVPLLEAMAHQVPILCSNATAVPEVVGDAALVVDARAPLALADGLQRLAADPTLRQTLVEAGRRRLADFSAADEFGRLLASFRSAADQPARWRSSGYHAIDGLIEPLAIFALPSGATTVRVRTRPLGIARTLEFWSGPAQLGRVAIAPHENTEGRVALPPGARVLSLRVPDASRLSATDPRVHGVLLEVLQAGKSDTAMIDLLAG